MVISALENETVNLESDLYKALGLQVKSKNGTRKPRVLSVVSLVLNRLVQKNDVLKELKQIEDLSTDFHGIRTPEIGIQDYVERIFTYSSCSPSCFVVAHIYLGKFLLHQNMHFTSLNAHRLLITAVMVAAKFMDDAVFNNTYYAKVGGISTKELNKLEMEFLFGIDFRLQITADTFYTNCLMLQTEACRGQKIERSIQVCGDNTAWSKKEDTAYATTAR